MKETFAVAAGLCFIGAFLTGMWPRSILDRVRLLRAQQGGDPDGPTGFAEVKAMRGRTYRSYLTGMIVSSALGLGFFVFTILALFTK